VSHAIAPQDLAALVRQAKKGDETAFSSLYRARVSEVFRYAKSIVRNPSLAEDVTAQTFLQAWKSLSKLKDVQRFDSWLFRIAHNVSLNETRRTPHAPLEAAAEPIAPARFSDPEMLLEGKLDAGAVREALLSLPKNLREVLVLRFYGGLSHEEVGVQLGKSRQNARVLQFRALKRLQADLLAAGFDADIEAPLS
jgi:RNA polymerase sigma-70 factor (ECF subfamily)